MSCASTELTAVHICMRQVHLKTEDSMKACLQGTTCEEVDFQQFFQQSAPL